MDGGVGEEGAGGRMVGHVHVAHGNGRGGRRFRREVIGVHSELGEDCLKFRGRCGALMGLVG